MFCRTGLLRGGRAFTNRFNLSGQESAAPVLPLVRIMTLPPTNGRTKEGHHAETGTHVTK